MATVPAEPPAEPRPPHSDLPSSAAGPDELEASQRVRETSWLWGTVGLFLLLLLPVGVGTVAVRHLLVLPALPRCWNVAQGSNSSSTRVYCSEILASKQTVEDLRRAIQLVNQVDSKDPLRGKSDRLIEQWTQDILRLGEAEFQAGSLDRARDIAKRVPFNVATADLAAAKIKDWETIWAKAEDLYSQVETEIDEENWFGALSTARLLLTVGNQYWANTQYQALMRLLQSARDSKAAAKRSPAPANKSVGVNDLIRQWETEQATTDVGRLDAARRLAQEGSPENLRAAVSEAEQVLYGTPQYDQAQALISTWRRQIETIEDRPRLNRAAELARQGDVRSLEAAIDEANQVTWGRSLHQEAREQAEAWRRQVHDLRLREQEEVLRQLNRTVSPAPPPVPVVPPSQPVIPIGSPVSLPESVLTLPAEGSPLNLPADSGLPLPGDRPSQDAPP